MIRPPKNYEFSEMAGVQQAIYLADFHGFALRKWVLFQLLECIHNHSSLFCRQSDEYLERG
jgi:hypothetical protein